MARRLTVSEVLESMTEIDSSSDTLTDANQDYSHLPQPARVVLHLVEPYTNRGHRIYTDRYYSSIPLAQTLLENGSSFTGTMVKSRVGLPDTVRSASFRLNGDETRVFRSGQLLTVAW